MKMFYHHQKEEFKPRGAIEYYVYYDLNSSFGDEWWQLVRSKKPRKRCCRKIEAAQNLRVKMTCETATW